MTKHFIATVPVTYKDAQGQEKTRFNRVGALFENSRRDSGEVFYQLKLDFPVGVTELVIFPPNSREPQE